LLLLYRIFWNYINDQYDIYKIHSIIWKKVLGRSNNDSIIIDLWIVCGIGIFHQKNTNGLFGGSILGSGLCMVLAQYLTKWDNFYSSMKFYHNISVFICILSVVLLVLNLICSAIGFTIKYIVRKLKG
jgi:hypothetical protein